MAGKIPAAAAPPYVPVGKVGKTTRVFMDVHTIRDQNVLLSVPMMPVALLPGRITYIRNTELPIVNWRKV